MSASITMRVQRYKILFNNKENFLFFLTNIPFFVIIVIQWIIFPIIPSITLYGVLLFDKMLVFFKKTIIQMQEEEK